jgi:hypothetical protein
MIDEGPLAGRRCANRARGWRGALSTHESGYVHRDVKPENIPWSRGTPCRLIRPATCRGGERRANEPDTGLVEAVR